MGKEWSQAQKKPRGWWWKIPLVFILLIFITLSILIFKLNSVALSQINSVLAESLSTGGHLDSLNLQLLEGDLTISGLTINPPEGFDAIPPLSMKNFKLSVETESLFDQPVIINKITLDELAITLVRDKQGGLSVLHLLPNGNETSTEARDKQSNDIKTDVQTPEIDTKEPIQVPAVLVKSTRINSLTLQVIDHLIGEKWTANVTLDMAIDNLQLNDLMNKDIFVDHLNLAISKLSIDQVPGFGDEKLLSLKQLSISTDQLNMASEELLVNRIALDTLSSSIQTNAQGLSNIQALSDAFIGEPAPNTGVSATESQPDASSPTPQKMLPVVNIGHLLVNNSSLTYSDAAIAGKLMTFPLSNIEFDARQLRLFDNNPEAVPASISLAFELKQPNSLPNAYIGAIAVMGPVNTGIPAINSQIRIGGFKLDTIDPLIPPSSRTALGADGFDAAVAIALNHQSINLNASLLSDQNIAYNAIAIKGPITAPAIEMGAILAGVYSRLSDGLLNVGKGGLNAGLDIASSGVDIAEAVGSGTLSIGKNLGISLFEAGTGLVTLDQQQLSEGLVGTSKGTLDIGFDSVAESGNVAKGGIKGSYQNLDGSSSLRAWNEGIKSRYEHSMQKAEGALSQMAYPPTIQ